MPDPIPLHPAGLTEHSPTSLNTDNLLILVQGDTTSSPVVKIGVEDLANYFYQLKLNTLLADTNSTIWLVSGAFTIANGASGTAICNLTSNYTLTFPATPGTNQRIRLFTYGTNSLTVNFNGKKVKGQTLSSVQMTGYQFFEFFWTGSTTGWITNPSDAFDSFLTGSGGLSILLWAGNGVAGRDIPGTGQGGDLWIVKSRTTGDPWLFVDRVRGAENYLEAQDPSYGQRSDTNRIQAFNSSGGLRVGNSTPTNANGYSYFALGFRTGISFSIVRHDFSAATDQISHGLGVRPDFVLVRRINAAGQWRKFHRGLPNPQAQYLNPSSNILPVTDTTIWQNKEPDDTYFYVGNDANVNGTGGQYIYYFWANSSGSKFGSYIGNGQAAGTIVNCGFQPRLLWLENLTSATTYWTYIYDTVRDAGDFSINRFITFGTPGTEGTSGSITILTNGFQLAGTDAHFNANGSTYLYHAWA